MIKFDLKIIFIMSNMSKTGRLKKFLYYEIHQGKDGRSYYRLYFLDSMSHGICSFFSSVGLVLKILRTKNIFEKLSRANRILDTLMQSLLIILNK